MLVDGFVACGGGIIKSAELVVHAELQMPEESVKHLQHSGTWNAHNLQLTFMQFYPSFLFDKKYSKA